MRYRHRRSSFLAVILTAVIGYAYYAFSDRKNPAPATAGPPVAVSSGSSIQGPYFSDRDRVADRIMAAINQTRRSLDIAVYSLTEPDIAATIQAAWRRGVKVRMVTDEGQSFDRHSEIRYLRRLGVPVRLSGGFRGQRSLMHDKFAIFDGILVETGSFNWTTSAANYNFENAILIRDPEVAARYEREFEHIWAQAR
ncbi:MAG TPA: phospholipase D-like domain-containing protein [Terriglobia bacterium]|jgi:phosphatidylserine/phosphatidylglycerophosphate/cardiolipin synthase-like enzyme|nr:phospholipase D-like domain-containing protein [Terriglobia bacterium]